MAGNFRGGRGRGRVPKLIGRGILESVKTDGPHNDWVGMPPYYIHHLSVDGESYSYLSPDPDLPDELTFLHAEDILGMYPDLPRKQRETAVLQKFPGVFIYGIGSVVGTYSSNIKKAFEPVAPNELSAPRLLCVALLLPSITSGLCHFFIFC